MFDWIRSQVLRVVRVPHDPDPPFGAPGSVRVFRAGRNYYKLRLLRWGAGQIGVVVGIIFSLHFIADFKHDVESAVVARDQRALVVSPTGERPVSSEAKRKRPDRDALQAFATRTPLWVVTVVELLELGGILLFIAQLPVTFAAVRLEYEMHWYIVTDRSLRIRTGLFKLTESTMSFANLQQVEVKQGPLQRFLGLADVHVQSAGGGGDRADSKGMQHDSLHTGIFHSVDNATEIRDLILSRLRQFRETGLGDPDHPEEPSSPSTDVAAAITEVLAEARALRKSVQLKPGE